MFTLSTCDLVDNQSPVVFVLLMDHNHPGCSAPKTELLDYSWIQSVLQSNNIQ